MTGVTQEDIFLSVNISNRLGALNSSVMGNKLIADVYKAVMAHDWGTDAIIEDVIPVDTLTNFAPNNLFIVGCVITFQISINFDFNNPYTGTNV